MRRLGRRIRAAAVVLAVGGGLALIASCGDDDGEPGVDGAVGADARPDAAVPDGAVPPDATVDAEVPPCEGDAIAVHDTAEVVLHAAQTYNGETGSPNPFTDVTLTATVRAPDGRTFTLDGFFDGDGSGGAAGDVWKVRIHVDQQGAWTWTTTSGDSGLDAQSGQVCGTGTLSGVFGAGPVVVAPGHPRALAYRDGDPVYLVGKFLDVAASSPIQYSHTFFSEQLSDTDRQAMLDRHVSMGLTKMNVYLANRGDYGGVSTTPWVGTAGANDKTRFDLARFHTYDTWTRALRDAGLAAQLWFFADDSGFGDLPDADRERLIRYGMARLSGYVNTLFTLCLEWQEGWSTTEVNSHGTFLQAENPWGRLVSVHGTTGDFAFPNASWVDYLDIQSGNDADYATVHAMGLTNRALADKPLINEEFGLGEEDTAHRQRTWAAFTAGGAGSGTGAFLQPLVTFVSQVPFARMEPADGLVLSGTGYCLAEAGQTYVVYLPEGGTVGLDLSAVSGTLTVQWFDPRTGAWSSGGTTGGGSPVSFTAPGSGDWTLYLHTP